MTKTKTRLWQGLAASALFGLLGCQGIDCPYDSTVVWTLKFFDSETEQEIKLPSELTINAAGAGTLFNKAKGVSSIPLPMSYNALCDTLFLVWEDNTPRPSNDGTTDSTDPVETGDSTSLGGATNEPVTPIPFGTHTLYVHHTNEMHFEALECPGSVFHTIEEATLSSNVSGTPPFIIDSLRITRNQVDYNDVENIRLYMHALPEPAPGNDGTDSDGQ